MPDPALIDRIRDNLSELGLEVTIGDNPAILRFEVPGTTVSWPVYVWLREGVVIVHSVAPFAIPEDRRDTVARYLTRANYGLILGNFELDLDDGELRFKTAVDFGAELDLEMLRRHIGAGMKTFDRYVPGVVAVLEGEEADAAIASVERSQEP